MDILSFEDFINENDNTSAEEQYMSVMEITDEQFFELYVSAHSGDFTLFQEEFVEMFNSAADIWMSDDKWEKLIEIFDLNDDTYEFITISGTTYDGDNTETVQSYINKGWTIFESEQNDDNYDSILYYHPNASRASNSIKKFSL